MPDILDQLQAGQFAQTNANLAQAKHDSNLNIKTIPLTKGKIAIVDDRDFEELSKWKWHYASGYAARNGKPDADGKRKAIRLHRVILGARPGQLVDHINGNTLDDRRCNLRIANTSQNCCNRRCPNNNKLGLKGVYFIARLNKYAAKVKLHGTPQYLGLFNTPLEAKAAYNNAARQIHGEFARMN